jgi:hypothetical protein
MVTQDAFTAADFAALRRHPVVAPMLAQLVWVTEDGRTVSLDEGEPDGPLRVAHPVDFVAEGSWVSWQERMFVGERRQPFKQAFRELYVLCGLIRGGLDVRWPLREISECRVPCPAEATSHAANRGSVRLRVRAGR